MTAVASKTTGEWIDLFEARRGVIAFVGAGGKKTIMLRIAEAHAGRVAITATAHIERLPQRYRQAFVVADGEVLYDRVMALQLERVVGFAKPSEQVGRYAGVTDEELLRLYREGRFEVCLVKSDGARGRLIKAPDEHEPPISAYATAIVPVLSARVIGMPLSDRVAHRPERVAAVTGLRAGEIIGPHHVARLLTSEQGALKNTAHARVMPVINMVDDAGRETLAREAATEALALTKRFDRVLLTAMKEEQPVVAVVER
ncbi:MAG: selenium cofactor biosynthesis protein YqeC [Chromatiales bacterium]